MTEVQLNKAPIPKDVRVLYLRADAFPVACIVTRMSPDRKSISYSLSIHNPLDVCIRKMGRCVAFDRLALHPVVIPIDPTLRKSSQIKAVVIGHILENGYDFRGKPYHGRNQTNGLPDRVAEVMNAWMADHQSRLSSVGAVQVSKEKSTEV